MSEINTDHNPHQVSGFRWLLPSLIGVFLVCIIFYFVNSCNNKHSAHGNDTKIEEHYEHPSPGNEADAAKRVAPPQLDRTELSLPGSVKFEARKGGVEDQLIAFLNDASAQPSKNTWFDFDSLTFKTASAEITAESMEQVQHIVAILKAYPSVQIKIGGYTDKTGDSTANQKLSQQRAEAVVKALLAEGAKPAQVTGAEGYGSQFAKEAASATDEARRKDRRISINVQKK